MYFEDPKDEATAARILWVMIGIWVMLFIGVYLLMEGCATHEIFN